MGYVETMFGHQSEINAIDSWRKERVVTGGRDRTVSLEDATACQYCNPNNTKRVHTTHIVTMWFYKWDVVVRLSRYDISLRLC